MSQEDLIGDSDDGTRKGREERMSEERPVPAKRPKRAEGTTIILRAVSRIVLELSQREGKREWLRTEEDLRALEVIEAWLGVTK